MKIASTITALAIMSAVVAILTWNYAKNNPEPEHYSSQTIQSQQQPEKPIKHIELNYKARFAYRDVYPMQERIHQYLDNEGVTYKTWTNTNKEVLKAETNDERIAKTLSTLDSERDRLTPEYPQWPNADIQPQNWEHADMYTITVKIRALHNQPNTIRGTIAATIIAACLALSAVHYIVLRVMQNQRHF